MVNGIPYDHPGGKRGGLSGQVSGPDGLDLQLLRRLVINAAGGGGQVNAQAVRPQLSQQFPVQQERGRRVEDQPVFSQRPRQILYGQRVIAAGPDPPVPLRKAAMAQGCRGRWSPF